MYHDKVEDNNDAVLNVLYKRNDLYTSLFNNEVTTGNMWKNDIVKLPHCPVRFNVRISLINSSM